MDWERLGRLYPEDKVVIALSMSDFAVRVCAEGIKAQNPNMSRAEPLERLRERIEWSKRSHRRL